MPPCIIIKYTLELASYSFKFKRKILKIWFSFFAYRSIWRDLIKTKTNMGCFCTSARTHHCKIVFLDDQELVHEVQVRKKIYFIEYRYWYKYNLFIIRLIHKRQTHNIIVGTVNVTTAFIDESYDDTRPS